MHNKKSGVAPGFCYSANVALRGAQRRRPSPPSGRRRPGRVIVPFRLHVGFMAPAPSRKAVVVTAVCPMLLFGGGSGRRRGSAGRFG